MQKDACKAYRPHLAIFRTVNGRGGFRWPSRANNEAPARPQNGQKERSGKKCTLPRTEACSPNISSRFLEVQAGACSTCLPFPSTRPTSPQSNYKKRDLQSAQTDCRSPKEKRPKYWVKKFALHRNIFPTRKGLSLLALLNTVDITLSGLPRTRWHPPPSSNLRPRHFH